MSKKAKKVAKRPAKKAVKRAAKKSAKKPAQQAVKYAALSAIGVPPPSKRMAAATIFVYDTGQGIRVRTSPQLISCGVGDIEWTVVNLTSGPMPDVDITWPNGSPWGGHAINIKHGNHRKTFEGAKAGRYKYNVTCNGYTEDPELEWPVN